MVGALSDITVHTTFPHHLNLPRPGQSFLVDFQKGCVLEDAALKTGARARLRVCNVPPSNQLLSAPLILQSCPSCTPTGSG